jgi:hypothetical protein
MLGEKRKLRTGLLVLQDSQIEGGKHEDDADVHHQACPELIPEERQIHTDHNGYQSRNVKSDRHVSCHFNHQFKYVNSRLPLELPDYPLGFLAAV